MLGPPIAEAILKKYGVPTEPIEHICRIVGRHHSGNDIDSAEFDCVWDADWLVNMPDVFQDRKKSELQGIIERTLKTAKGRELANKLYVQS